jgi:DNA-binding YbaB/EbfC family protein
MGNHWFFGVFERLGQHRQMLEQAAAVYESFGALHRRLRQHTVKADAGAGMVEVEMNALAEAVSIKIDPELLKPEEREFLEGLLVEAVNAAVRKAMEAQVEKMQEAIKGLDLTKFQPFLQGFFSTRKNDLADEK